MGVPDTNLCLIANMNGALETRIDVSAKARHSSPLEPKGTQGFAPIDSQKLDFHYRENRGNLFR
jgi:hypothetical protein